MKDYYQVLEVLQDASQEATKTAYLKLALQFHPDKNIGNEKASEAKMKEINEAYGVLGNPANRMQYDLSRRPQPMPQQVVFVYYSYQWAATAASTNTATTSW